MGKNQALSGFHGSAQAAIFLFSFLAPALVLFNVISLFVPFFLFSRTAKVFFLAACLLVWLLLYLGIRRKIAAQPAPRLQQFWDAATTRFAAHALFAAALTVFVISLTRFAPPPISAFLEAAPPPAVSSGFSIFYRIWAFVLPAARTLLLFLFYLFVSVIIRLRSSSRRGSALHFILLFLLSYIVISSFNYRNALLTGLNLNPAIAALAIFLFALLPLALAAFLARFPRSQPWVFLAVLALVACLQVVYIRSLPNVQTSDFWDFNLAALKLAAGQPGVSLNKYASFTRLLSLFYRIHPDAATAKTINLLLTLLSMVGVYCIGSEIGQGRAGVIAAWLFGMLPAQSGMVAIVNNDIPSLTFIIWGVFFLIRFLNGAQWHCLAAGAFLFGVALSIRSSMVIYAPLLALAFFFNTKSGWKGLARTGLAIILGILLGMLLVNAAVAPARVEGMRIDESRNVIFPLLNGTNIIHEGRVNYADSGLVNSWSGAEIWRQGLPIVLDRIFSHPLEYFQLLKVKFSYLFGDATYVADYVFNFEQRDLNRLASSWRFSVEEVHLWFALFSQYAYWVFLGLSLLFIFYYRSSLTIVSWIGALLFLCMLAAYAFFEVQPRYNRPLIPFLALFAGLVLSSLASGGARAE